MKKTALILGIIIVCGCNPLDPDKIGKEDLFEEEDGGDENEIIKCGQERCDQEDQICVTNEEGKEECKTIVGECDELGECPKPEQECIYDGVNYLCVK
jgi:hypothetical protein